MKKTSKRCLIIGCSQAKVKSPNSLPAIERYDGPAFRVLRKYLADGPDPTRKPDVFVLSAEFGLISGSKWIPNYDRRMTRERAEELCKQVRRVFERQIANGDYTEVFVSAGKTYSLALNGCKDSLPSKTSLIVSSAPAGMKLVELKSWLYGEKIKSQGREYEPFLPTKPGANGKTVQIRGRQITMSYKEIMRVARRALAKDKDRAYAFQSWYALVGKEKVGPKWLVSQLTGLPVSEFVADEARRVLRGLGVPFYRQE